MEGEECIAWLTPVWLLEHEKQHGGEEAVKVDLTIC